MDGRERWIIGVFFSRNECTQVRLVLNKNMSLGVAVVRSASARVVKGDNREFLKWIFGEDDSDLSRIRVNLHGEDKIRLNSHLTRLIQRTTG